MELLILPQLPNLLPQVLDLLGQVGGSGLVAPAPLPLELLLEAPGPLNEGHPLPGPLLFGGEQAEVPGAEGGDHGLGNFIFSRSDPGAIGIGFKSEPPLVPE